MDTKLSNPLSTLDEEKSDIEVIYYAPRRRTDGRFLKTIRPIVKWFGILSTLGLGIAALTPDSFKLSQSLQGWTFLAFVVWFFAFCVGVFNL